MIRVFLIAVVAFGALVLVARNLGGLGPEDPPAAVPAAAADPATDPSPFGGWSGSWEGTLNAYRQDGTLEYAMPIRRDHRAVSSAEARIVTTMFEPGASPTVIEGVARVLDGRLELTLPGPDGPARIYRGKRLGAAILWHRVADEGEMSEAFREEVLRLPDGDLLTIDGYRDRAGEVLLIEGRCRRAVAEEGP